MLSNCLPTRNGQPKPVTTGICLKTAATKYPDTKAAAYIRRHCDQLVDYKDLNRGYLY